MLSGGWYQVSKRRFSQQLQQQVEFYFQENLKFGGQLLVNINARFLAYEARKQRVCCAYTKCFLIVVLYKERVTISHVSNFGFGLPEIGQYSRIVHHSIRVPKFVSLLMIIIQLDHARIRPASSSISLVGPNDCIIRCAHFKIGPQATLL